MSNCLSARNLYFPTVEQKNKTRKLCCLLVLFFVVEDSEINQRANSHRF